MSHYECDVWLLQNAVVRGTLLALQYMGKDEGGKGGVVVNIASVLGLIPFEGSPVYVATKHVVIGLTRSFEFRQIAFEKPSEISITIGRDLIEILSLFPTYEYTDG